MNPGLCWLGWILDKSHIQAIERPRTSVVCSQIFNNVVKARTSFNCARYMEIRIVVLDSLKIISMNVLFRFFYIVHADKGLVVCFPGLMMLEPLIRWMANQTLDWPMVFTRCWGSEEKCRIWLKSFLHSVTVTVAQLMAWPGSVMFAEVSQLFHFCFYFQIPPNTHCLPSHIWLPSQEYPKNTVRGRVCLGLRLDWDLNSTKETSDIYVKPRLAIYPYKDTENSKSNNPNVFQVDCSRSYDRLVFFYVLHHHQVTIFINKEGLRYICISSILSGPVHFCMFKFVSLFFLFLL